MTLYSDPDAYRAAAVNGEVDIFFSGPGVFACLQVCAYAFVCIWHCVCNSGLQDGLLMVQEKQRTKSFNKNWADLPPKAFGIPASPEYHNLIEFLSHYKANFVQSR